MKKILNFLGVVSMISSSTSYAVSCGGSKEKDFFIEYKSNSTLKVSTSDLDSLYIYDLVEDQLFEQGIVNDGMFSEKDGQDDTFPFVPANGTKYVVIDSDWTNWAFLIDKSLSEEEFIEYDKQFFDISMDYFNNTIDLDEEQIKLDELKEVNDKKAVNYFYSNTFKDGDVFTFFLTMVNYEDYYTILKFEDEFEKMSPEEKDSKKEEYNSKRKELSNKIYENHIIVEMKNITIEVI